MTTRNKNGRVGAASTYIDYERSEVIYLVTRATGNTLAPYTKLCCNDRNLNMVFRSKLALYSEGDIDEN